MIYPIEQKNDLSGAMLVIRFPEEELDRKALSTIQADPPAFLVPFRYRSVDGMAECTYELGSRSKLQYRFGRHTPEEYAEFWNGVLQPLLECADWFLKPMSFVLDTRYLYVDRDGTVSYLYVPSLEDCQDFGALREMAAELSRQNSVSDPALENQVLRAIMQDFQPKAFLQMLRQARPAAPVPREHQSRPEPVRATAVQDIPVQSPPVQSPPPVPAEDPLRMPPVEPPAGLDDIVIHLDGDGAAKEKKPKKEKKPLFGGKKEKPEKKEKAEKKGGLFGKKEPPREIFLGAAAQDFQEAPPAPPVRPVEAAPVWIPATEESGVTQLLDESGAGACLRLMGDPALPREIPVDIQPGQVFSIGRFDVSVGHRQNDFEFDKKTKAVSRRHAVIERQADGSYALVDLSSSAGTFVDGQRLTANVPQVLHRGARVAFGTAGADYVWEE
ncbi:FHA domain-containing protein [Dysosmobacter sp.]|jgi:pSer/pThr/pTyr-binding forkhead associated (FHA) protein|uniref:FHA domain-containing protein n=1 Tax=Dysosmobacter sp. TaxID=2591382 RepID=UPI003D9306D5